MRTLSGPSEVGHPIVIAIVFVFVIVIVIVIAVKFS